jgi:cathepsin L
MKRYRTLCIVLVILFFVGIPVLLSAAEQRITPPGVAFDYKARELKAPPHIVSKLNQLRNQIAAQKLSFKVGYTGAMDFDLAKLAALKVSPNFGQMVREQNALAIKRLKELPVVSPVCSYQAPSFDLRTKGAVTPVKDQGYCGSCWDFATLGAFEGSWSIINSQPIDSSEQDILDCSQIGSCDGAWIPAFQYLIDKGVTTEANYPYRRSKGSCNATFPRLFKADAWGYVGSDHNIPSVTALKQALCANGPLYITVRATGAFQAYTSGIFNEHSAGNINHAITLIGWDDTKQAWLIKNSWGTDWGDTCGYGTERGYMWISYTSNSIGYGAAWVRAHGAIALRSAANGKYVSVDNGTEKSLIANNTSADLRARFEMVNLDARSIALKSMANGKIVCADPGGSIPLIANRTTAGPWETFQISDAGVGKVVLRADSNDKYVSVQNTATNNLIANRSTVGPWETFEIVNMGPGKIALKSTGNGKFVSAESSGAKALAANRATAGSWETFETINLAGSRKALRSLSNGKYVSVDVGAAKILSANGRSVEPAQTFEMTYLGGGKIALRSRANGKYVCAENAGANPLIANRTSPGAWETFEMFNAPIVNLMQIPQLSGSQ